MDVGYFRGGIWGVVHRWDLLGPQGKNKEWTTRWQFAAVGSFHLWMEDEPFQSEETICRLSGFRFWNSKWSLENNTLWRTELMKWLTILYPSYQEYPKHHRHCSQVHLLPNEASCEDFKWKRFTLRHCNWWSKFCQNHHTMYSSIQPMSSRSNKVN
jgi:hypothetical protein